MLIKVERLASDLSQVRLFHTSVTRANATWPTWPGEPGFTGTFEDFVAERFPSSQAGDFAVREAGIVSEETYVEQGLYWETGHRPLIRYILDRYRPDVALVGYPVTDEFQHQFLGLITRRLPNGARNPAYDDVQVNGTPDGRVRERTRFIRSAYEGADRFLGLAQDLLHHPTTFASSDHGTRSFCARCGTQLTFESSRAAGELDVTTCSLDDPESVPPRDHTRTSSQLSWVGLADRLPRFSEGRSTDSP